MQSHRTHGSSAAAAGLGRGLHAGGPRPGDSDLASAGPRGLSLTGGKDSEGCRSAPLYSAGEEPTRTAKHPRQIWLPSVRRTARGRDGGDAEVLLVGGAGTIRPRGR